MYLHMNNISGSITSELGMLQKLTSLLLWWNSLSGVIPAAISNCSSLVVLDLSANSLSRKIPGDLRKLVLLQQLHLSDNLFPGSIPWELSNCTSLITLQLDKNQLSGSIPAQIGNLKSLQSLIFWGNSVSGTIPCIWEMHRVIDTRFVKKQAHGYNPERYFRSHQALQAVTARKLVDWRAFPKCREMLVFGEITGRGKPIIRSDSSGIRAVAEPRVSRLVHESFFA
ncbi:hypothetical protein RND81_02G076700 [Saponaria officinalis]|uniref:Uncharacterized protein n=1 Tax=Saponaria officinalis TaxID=3572 RepID=A0AAW1MND9_SAPOF